MQTVLNQMLEKYTINNFDDGKNALKEVIQEVALCGLSRAGFFRTAAFYGGTALRIFYGLDRFSEDLDFSLLSPDPKFDLTKYFSVLEKEINSLGLHFSVEEKKKSADSKVKSAFLKGNTLEHVFTFYGGVEYLKNVNPREVVKIKFEVDTDPPPHAGFENKYGILPYPYQVKLYDLPSLFAGKIHAVLCRAWGNRVKGRDLYDYVFYLAKGATVNLPHLKAKLVSSGFIPSDFNLTGDNLKELLNRRFAEIDFEQAKQDVVPFVKDKSGLELWSAEFFQDVTKRLNV